MCPLSAGPWGGLEGRSTGREQRLERPCRPLYLAVSWAWPNGAVGLTGFWLMNLVWATQWGKWGPHRAGSDGSEGEPYILCGTEWGASAVNGGWGWCVHVFAPPSGPWQRSSEHTGAFEGSCQESRWGVHYNSPAWRRQKHGRASLQQKGKGRGAVWKCFVSERMRFCRWRWLDCQRKGGGQTLPLG